jgi:hypothetical protein
MGVGDSRAGPRALIAVAALALVAAPAAVAGGPTMVVGAAEDNVKQVNLVDARAKVELARRAGLKALRITAQWARGQTAPAPEERTRLRMAGEAAHRAGLTIYVSMYPYGSSQTPLTASDRRDFALFAVAVVRAMPRLRHVIVGNEPNLNRFWMPQFGPDGNDVAAPAYLELLAQTYDAVKAVRPSLEVIGGAVSARGGDRPGTGRDTHSPTRFIPDLGAAYRASGRSRPIMDAFAFHPYPETSSTPPTRTHPGSTTVGLADYGKLVGLLGRAFDGTAQRGSALPIVYAEFGLDTVIPPGLRRAYTGVEPPTTRPIDEHVQGRMYRQALELAFCQPTVRAFFLFHTVDERDLNRLQTGMYYADERPKLSRGPVRNAALAVGRGIAARCPGLRLRPSLTARFPRALDGSPVSFGLTCDIDCTYTARVVALPGGSTVLSARGRALGRTPRTVAFPPRRLAPGRHRIAVAVRAAVNVGETVARESPALASG